MKLGKQFFPLHIYAQELEGLVILSLPVANFYTSFFGIFPF